MNYIELFAGIGGFRAALDSLGHKCVGWVEWDKFARQSYEAIFPSAKEEWTANDITTVTDESLRELSRNVGGIDLIAGGFPCQAFSVAGKRRGFEDTRGTLFFEVARFANVLRPRLLLLENVVGLLNHEGGDTFRTILSAMDELGYDSEWQVLNAKDHPFNIPQSRERVFIIGHLRGRGGRKIFPLGTESKTSRIDVIGTVKTREDAIGQRDVVHSTDGIVGTLTATDYKSAKLIMVGMLDTKGHEATRRVYSPTGISPTLTTMGGGNREPKIIIDDTQGFDGVRVYEDVAPTLRSQRHGLKVKVSAVIDPGREKKTQNGRVIKDPDEPMFTLTAQDRHGVKLEDEKNQSFRIRRLTPLECWRLQGRTDDEFYAAKNSGVSDSQLYKQAGNSLVPQIVVEIAKHFD